MATHAASPNSTHPKAPPLPQEDLGSVLERFQKWTGRQPEPVRELTYEEAAARSRRRVYVEEDTVTPAPGKTVSETVKAKPSASKSKTAKSAQTGSGKSAAKATAKPARAANKKPASRKAVAAETTSHNTAASAYQTIQKAAGEIVPTPPADFEQVLAAHFHEQTAPLTVKADTKAIAPLPGDAPAVHLTVRLAHEERNAVRERAHDLGITPSAYMRHCILEIDSLRAELETSRLAYAQASDAVFLETPTLEGGSRLSLNRKSISKNHPTDGAWLTRLIHFMLPGKAKGQALSTNA